MSCAPATEIAHRLDKFLTRASERVSDLGRGRGRDPTADDAVRFELTKLRGQNFFADAGKKVAKLGEAFRIEAQMPNGEHLPFSADGVDGSLHRATVVSFQKASGLTKMCVLPGPHQIVIPFGRRSESG